MANNTKQTGITVKLAGCDGNAFAILGKIRQTLRKSGRADWQELNEAFHKEATSGDYNHLLATCMEWFEVE